MTFRISQFRAACGLCLLVLPVAALAQAPRYQSPIAAPNAPQPQVALPTPAAITPNGVVVEDVIVRVNDQIITRSDLERSQQQMAMENQQAQASPQEAADRQKNLLRDMIDQQLLLSRAKELGLNADAEVIRRLDEIRKQNHLDNMEDLEKAARQQGVSFEDFKANIKNGILTQQVVRDEVGRRLQMTQGQEQAYYDEHKNEFAQPEQVRLSEILIPTPADANETVVAQAQAKADSIAAKVKAGEKFDELAKSYSGGPTASQGGDLGLFKRGALAKVLEDQTFVLPTGGVTAPIRTRQGFVILKVTDHQDAGVPPLKDIEPQIQEAMYYQAMQPALRAYLTKLREEAYIDIKPGFVDSGASPRQTKPVFSAYAPPAPKKKKVEQQKQRFDRGGAFSTAKKTTPPPVAAPAAVSAAAPAPVTTADLAATATAAGAAAASTATTPTTATKAAVPAKPKKIKREKVRYGQAPRNALPPGPQETAVGAGAGEATSTQTADAGTAVAPGAAIAPVAGTTTQFAPTPDVDPLAPKPTSTGKTRYSARARTEAADKAAKKQAAVKQKSAFTPAPASAEEKADVKTQSTPLGMNGDTATKQKPVKVKGAPKERLQDKSTAPPPEPPAPEPTVNPALGATPAGVTPSPVPVPQTPAPQTQPAAPTSEPQQPAAPQPNN